MPEKSISIAAPASYWYLKSFPIADMAKSLDYIVYMTYDLHGQWDYGNKWSQDGCSSGSCLRSHVNLTETNFALAMITKAGVPANKVAVGVSSYGRAFGMMDQKCTGDDCSFKGPDSAADVGECTQTAGILANAEIDRIISFADPGTSAWYDTDSNSNILVFNSTWVSYMDDTTKDSRTGYYKDLGFLGTVDWTVDLQQFQDDDDGNPDGDEEDQLPPSKPLTVCDASFNTMDDLDAAADTIPDDCKAIYTVATLSSSLDAAMKNYTDMLNDSYDKKFQTYAQAVADNAGDSVNDFVTDNGNAYFSCIVAEAAQCCDYCGKPEDPSCAYCVPGNFKQCHKTITARADVLNVSSPLFHQWDTPRPQSVLLSKVVNQSEPCPPDYSKRGSGFEHDQSVYWNLLPEKADQFFTDLNANTSIVKDKIGFGRHDRGSFCAPGAKPDSDCWAVGYDFDFPVSHGYTAADVADPKEIVQKALENANNLQGQLQDVLLELQFDAYYGDDFELLDAISLPVLMILDGKADFRPKTMVTSTDHIVAQLWTAWLKSRRSPKRSKQRNARL